MDKDVERINDHSVNILETIDFFSQVLHPEQLEVYGYNYIHQLLKLERSMIFMKNPSGSHLVLKGATNVNVDAAEIELTDRVKELATKVGVVLYGDLDRYLPESLMAIMNANMLIPLIVAEELIGLIITDSWKKGSEEDFTFVEAVKKMINNAFYTGIQMIENRNYKHEADRKLYDQMLMHQIVRMMLSELEIEQLLGICVDGVRELTASAQTGLFLIDEQVGVLKLKHFEDLVHYRKAYGEVSWASGVPAQKMIYDLNLDKAELAEAIGREGIDVLEQIGTKYLVLLKKNPVIGFLTVGDTVAGQIYSQATLEMVESIMGTVCIAIENANHHQKLKLKHKQLEESYQAMKTLSNTIEVIGGAGDLEEFSALLAQDLSIQLGLGQCGIAKKVREGFEVVHCSIPELEQSLFTLTDTGLSEIGKGLVLDFQPESASKYVYEIAVSELFSQQFLLSPLFERGIDDNEPEIIGLVMGTDFNHEIGQFETSYLEAISQGATPLFKRFISEKEVKRLANGNPLQPFLDELVKRDEEQRHYWMPYRLYYKKARWHLSSVDLNGEPERFYRIGSGVFAFYYVEELVDTSEFDGYFEGSYEDVLQSVENYLNA